MSCNSNQDCTCGCCSGIAVETPQGESNAAGQSAIAYRTGTWASFNASMVARLSSSSYPALSGLMTRSNDDFTIAFLDASAVMLDILTFYQERLANESYLRTATQLYSLTQLSQLIGYQPSPGVSASVYLAFTLRAATGLPANLTTQAITIPAGSQVQSVPVQGQTAQSFQTSADILAKPDWNALPIQTGKPWTPKAGATSAYLAGTATGLNPGDAILVVGDERAVANTASTQWDLRILTSVQPETANARTLIQWTEGLGGAYGTPAKINPKIYALRQKASLFGYNAINPLMLAHATRHALQDASLVSTASPPEWIFGTASGTPSDLAGNSLIDLDSTYSKFANGGWIALLQPDNSGNPIVSLYNATNVTTISRSDYGINAKITRILADTSSALASYYGTTRQTSVLGQSEALAPAEQPLDHPLYGAWLDLEVFRPDLAGVTAVAITGTSQKIQVNFPTPDTTGLAFTPYDTTQAAVPLTQGQLYTLLGPPDLLKSDGSIPHWLTSTKQVTLIVADASGRTGTITSSVNNFALVPPATTDPIVQETALVSQIIPVAEPFPHTRILLQSQLLNCYCRATTSVNANVAAATAGSPVTELLGSGSASTPNQQFKLKQSPLTYTQATTASGSQSTLQITANGATWTAVPTLYNQPATAQVYATMNLPGGVAQVIFGDGVEGAMLPTGQSNIQAQYRIGIGSAGNVAAGAITTLMDRPVGVSGVINPLPAAGGQDAQTIDGIRANAPASVLTLGRAVSITDYQNIAANFAGIAKASALWIPNGVNRGVFLTVAAAGGVALQPGSQTIAKLITALNNCGNPNVMIQAQSFLETTFGLTADLAYNSAYDPNAVQAAVLLQLQQTFSFANRNFGQGVSADEIAALIQGVTGVVAVNVTSLSVIATSKGGDIGTGAFSISAYNTWLGQGLTTPLPRAKAKGRICPYVPLASPGALPNPAEILVLDPNPNNVTLGAMA